MYDIVRWRWIQGESTDLRTCICGGIWIGMKAYRLSPPVTDRLVESRYRPYRLYLISPDSRRLDQPVQLCFAYI